MTTGSGPVCVALTTAPHSGQICFYSSKRVQLNTSKRKKRFKEEEFLNIFDWQFLFWPWWWEVALRGVFFYFTLDNGGLFGCNDHWHISGGVTRSLFIRVTLNAVALV